MRGISLYGLSCYFPLMCQTVDWVVLVCFCGRSLFSLSLAVVSGSCSVFCIASSSSAAAVSLVVALVWLGATSCRHCRQHFSLITSISRRLFRPFLVAFRSDTVASRGTGGLRQAPKGTQFSNTPFGFSFFALFRLLFSSQYPNVWIRCWPVSMSN